MNEKDIYIKLIDNKEADRILKIFNIHVKTNDLSLKKMNILKIFRGQINARKKINPFYRSIRYHQNVKLKDCLSEEKFFQLLGSANNDKLPDYKKFANALLYYPDKTKEMLPLIEKNIKNKRPIFSNDSLENLEFFKNYFIKEYNTNKYKFVNEYIECNYNEQFKEYCRKIKGWNIQDLYNNIIDKKMNKAILLNMLIW